MNTDSFKSLKIDSLIHPSLKHDPLEKVELVKVRTDAATTDEAKLFKDTSAIVESFLILFFGFFILCTITVSFAKGLSKKLEGKDFATQSIKIPCSKCHFFSTNAHLRCAVHPTTTMTEQASHCPDFTPRNK